MGSQFAALFSLVLLAVWLADMTDQANKKYSPGPSLHTLNTNEEKFDFLKDHETGKYYKLIVGQKVTVHEVQEHQVTKPIINPK